MIHVFHGFLGSPADLSFIHSEDNTVVFHDLYKEDPSSIAIQSEDILIGYSMGGRVVMEIAVRHHFNLKKLVIINSHPGLPPQDRKERSLWEESVMIRLRSLSKEEFLQYWNTLPLFSADLPLKELSLENYNKSEKIFKRYRLSEQECFLPQLEANKDKILWIAGIHDKKYADLAREFILPLNIPCVFVEGGHRLYQHPEALKKILKERNII